MFKEIYFVITRDKEKELFEYISSLSFCKIVNPVNNTANAVGDMDSHLYLIVNDDFKDIYIPGEAFSSALKMPTDPFFSYLSYERFDFDEQKSKNRLFLVSYLKRNKQIKVAFKCIKKWIVKNSTTRTKFGEITVHVVE